MVAFPTNSINWLDCGVGGPCRELSLYPGVRALIPQGLLHINQEILTPEVPKKP